MFLKLSGASAGQGGEGTCFGDSGGPIFLPDQTTIVGINSFVTNGRCAGVTYAQRMDLPRILNWVGRFL
jgi:secreted trypsin-like serine protease